MKDRERNQDPYNEGLTIVEMIAWVLGCGLLALILMLYGGGG